MSVPTDYEEAVRYGKHSHTTIYGKDPRLFDEKMRNLMGPVSYINPPNYVGRHRISNTIGFYLRTEGCGEGFVTFKRHAGGL